MPFKEIFKACVPLEQDQLVSSLYLLLYYIQVLFLLNERLKYAAAVVSFNLGVPSFQHFSWEWKRTSPGVDYVLF